MKNPNGRDEDRETKAAVELTGWVEEMWDAGASLNDISGAVQNGLPPADDGGVRRCAIEDE